jgi:predicted transcriptional regulator
LNDGPGERSRADLLHVIREQRGIHKSELMRRCGKGWGNVGHHLKVLESLGLIDTETRGRLLWIFDKQVDQLERDCIVATHRTPARRILEAISLRTAPTTIRTLSAELDLSKKVIRLHLSTLQRAQAIKKVEGHPPAFEPVVRQQRP